MSSGILTAEIAEPYAQALLSLGRDSDQLEALNQSVIDLLALMDESDELTQFLASPVVEAPAKKAVLKQVMGDANQYLVNFLLLLVDRGRIALLKPILKQFQALVRELNQTVLAEVTSAVELSDEQKETVRQKVLSMTSARQVELNTSIDPDLLGGVIIKVGSQIVDASLRGQLRRIGLQLSSATAR
ncbi:MAG: F0F1 ATP synthase subunit delta [Leptolyngbya sp. SIO4C1]|nr:F0F1 ATP synthase subunit delta [Leptolyngbya sp. SIO4C1]